MAAPRARGAALPLLALLAVLLLLALPARAESRRAAEGEGLAAGHGRTALAHRHQWGKLLAKAKAFKDKVVHHTKKVVAKAKAVYHKHVKPVFNKIKDVYHKHVKPVFKKIGSLYHKHVKPVLKGIFGGAAVAAVAEAAQPQAYTGKVLEQAYSQATGPDKGLAFGDKAKYPEPPGQETPVKVKPALDYLQLLKHRIDGMTSMATRDAMRRQAAVISLNQDPGDFEQLAEKGVTPAFSRQVLGPSQPEEMWEKHVAEAIAAGEMTPENDNVITWRVRGDEAAELERQQEALLARRREAERVELDNA